MTSIQSSASKEDVFISIVVPCFNVESIVTDYLSNLYKSLEENYLFFEIICVDDASTDATLAKIAEILKTKGGMRLIELSHRHGLDSAACAGLKSAIGDYIVTLDIQETPLEVISEVIRVARDQQAIVYGVRSERAYGRFSMRQWGGGLFAWFCRKYLNVDIQRGSGLLRVFPRAAANMLLSRLDKNRSLRILSVTIRFPLKEFHYRPAKLTGALNQKHDGFFDGMDLAFDLLASVSRHPLRWMSRMSVFIAGLNVLYAIYIVFIYFFKKDIAAGWVSLSMQQAGMFFLLFVVLTVLSEYLGRLLLEVQKAPNYSIKTETSSSILINDAEKINVYRSE